MNSLQLGSCNKTRSCLNAEVHQTDSQPICSSIPLQKQTRLFIVKGLASFYHALE